MSVRSSRHGIAPGDVLLVIAVLCVGAALAWPWIERDRLRREADAAAIDVEALRVAVTRYRGAEGAWPPAGTTGVLPAALAPLAPPGLRMTSSAYRLEWSVWETVEAPVVPEQAGEPPDPGQLEGVDTIQAPPPRFESIAGITVHAGDARLLELLLERYGSARSFVRDSSWTLVLRRGRGTG